MTDRKRPRHPQRAALLEYAVGELPAGPRTHLELCRPCRDEFQCWTRLAEDARGALPEPADPARIDRAVAAFSPPPMPAPAIAEDRGVVSAEAAELLAASGVRGRFLAEPVRVRFAAQALELDLEMSTARDGVRVSGQAVGGPPPLLARVEGAGVSREVAVDEQGLFTIDGVPTGDQVDIVLELDGDRVRFAIGGWIRRLQGRTAVDGLGEPEDSR